MVTAVIKVIIIQSFFRIYTNLSPHTSSPISVLALHCFLRNLSFPYRTLWLRSIIHDTIHISTASIHSNKPHRKQNPNNNINEFKMFPSYSINTTMNTEDYLQSARLPSGVCVCSITFLKIRIENLKRKMCSVSFFFKTNLDGSFFPRISLFDFTDFFWAGKRKIRKIIEFLLDVRSRGIEGK